MGAAGLTSSSCEMGSRAGNGVEIDIELVPQRETGMTPYEIMLSESQERMLIVAKKGREDEVLRVFERWDLNAAVVGEVTDDGFVRLIWHGVEVAAIPVDPISTEAPVYERPLARPAYADAVAPILDRQRVDDGDLTDEFLRLVASPNLCSKHWIFAQYDTTVRTNTLAGPERRDAAVVRVKGTGRALAMTSDVNPVYCYLDPYEGGKQAVAEAARNIAASGARPVAITDCLNFGSPERPDIMWFYNETEGNAVYPTPTVGMVGILDDEASGRGISFPQPGLDIIILGDTREELGGSEWQQAHMPDTLAAPPRVDLERERALIELLIALAENKLVQSVHDLPNGAGSVTFEGVQKWTRLQISKTPGMHLTLGGVVAALLGLLLSLFIRPRRVWVRADGSRVDVGGLDRSSAGDVQGEVDEVVGRLRQLKEPGEQEERT